MNKDMEWIAIRSIYHFGVNSKGVNIYEERVVVFEAKDFQEAHSKAKEEAESYANENDFTMHTEQVAYKQDGEKLIDGYEVWSELFESDLDINDFYQDRYTKYLYHANNA